MATKTSTQYFMKIFTIIGARPQFIKAYPVCKALKQTGYDEYIVHTGQHYDYQMSRVFFDELGIPEPNTNLGIGSSSHGRQTGEMLVELEQLLLSEKPDWVLVYGDTNSTLAGALAAVKLQIPIMHVEAGLRSFNRSMPEEHNRVIADHCAELLICPTQTAVNNLSKEGITHGVHLVGDTMLDAVLEFRDIAKTKSSILNDLGLVPKQYLLATLHRPYNTDVPETLYNILTAFGRVDRRIVFPVHPRTIAKIKEYNINLKKLAPNILVCDPVGYLDMLMLENNAEMILTDSGGIQKEAYFFQVPCITLRPETEWIETVDGGWNILVGTAQDKIVQSVHDQTWFRKVGEDLFGDGQAAKRIVALF
jgi:UDP-GlcNAc3NAcA epimerase